MTITHITPKEQQLMLEIECMRHQIEFWKRCANELHDKLDALEKQLDATRRVVADLDRRILRSGV